MGLHSIETVGEDSLAHHQFVHRDILGTTMALSGSLGRAEALYRTDPWGQVTDIWTPEVDDWATGDPFPTTNHNIYTGHQHDEGTGLIYARARYLDPEIGRFPTQDTYLGEAMNPPSLHRYNYVHGNPTAFTDPTGNIPFEVLGAIDDPSMQVRGPSEAEMWEAELRAFDARRFSDAELMRDVYRELRDARIREFEETHRMTYDPVRAIVMDYADCAINGDTWGLRAACSVGGAIGSSALPETRLETALVLTTAGTGSAWYGIWRAGGAVAATELSTYSGLSLTTMTAATVGADGAYLAAAAGGNQDDPQVRQAIEDALLVTMTPGTISGGAVGTVARGGDPNGMRLGAMSGGFLELLLSPSLRSGRTGTLGDDFDSTVTLTDADYAANTYVMGPDASDLVSLPPTELMSVEPLPVSWDTNIDDAMGFSFMQAPQPRSPITDPSRLLTYSPTTKTLGQVRRSHPSVRWRLGEGYHRELYGSNGGQHYSVPPGGEIVGRGGRHVDSIVPVGSSGAVEAHEVKLYQLWRTVDGEAISVEVPYSNQIRQQVLKDAWLRDNRPGYDPRWHFFWAPPSRSLREALHELGIMFVVYH